MFENLLLATAKVGDKKSGSTKEPPLWLSALSGDHIFDIARDTSANAEALIRKTVAAGAKIATARARALTLVFMVLSFIYRWIFRLNCRDGQRPAGSPPNLYHSSALEFRRE